MVSVLSCPPKKISVPPGKSSSFCAPSNWVLRTAAHRVPNLAKQYWEAPRGTQIPRSLPFRDDISRENVVVAKSAASPRISLMESIDDISDDETQQLDYGRQSIFSMVARRGPWLAIFCVGLILAAGVVEEFDDLIAKHVELSFFVPLIMGHGGNTGSQTTCACIRALALKQVSYRSVLKVVAKEATAGAIMGAGLGLAILCISLVTHISSPEVGLVVAVTMPVVSLWSNGLGAFLTLASAKLKLDPAMTSAPLMTTIVDTTGLVIYFVIAQKLISETNIASVSNLNEVLATLPEVSSELLRLLLPL